MMDEKKVVDASGKEVKHTSIPVIKIRDFIFSFYKMQEEDFVKIEKGKPIKPLDVIKEMRAMQRENRDFLTALAMLIVSSIEGPKHLDEIAKEMKLVIKDLQGKQYYPPSNEEELTKE
jgi:hypothetical protein